MRKLPHAVADLFPDPAGLPFPCSGVSGLRLFLASADPAAIHDAFLASTLIGKNGFVECWLEPGTNEHPVGSDSSDGAPPPAGPTDQPTAAAVALANDQLPDWAGMLGIDQPGNLAFRQRSLSCRTPAEEDFHLAAVAGLPVLQPQVQASSLAALYASLKPGGELFLTVLLSNRRLGSGVTNEELEAAGVGAVLYYEDFIAALKSAGFVQPRVLRIEPWDLTGADDDAQFLLLYSKVSAFTIRAQKNRLLDATCEDYGHWVIYKGSLEGSDEAYTLDLQHKLLRGQSSLVCANTAAMLGEEGISWLSNHFVVTGDRSVHYGPYSSRAPGNRSERCCM